jgi:hypothetical protein
MRFETVKKFINKEFVNENATLQLHDEHDIASARVKVERAMGKVRIHLDNSSAPRDVRDTMRQIESLMDKLLNKAQSEEKLSNTHLTRR